jgi:hypothetical protein
VYLALLVWYWYQTPLGPSMPFLDIYTCVEGGYLFLPGFFSLYDAIHGWMTRRMNGWTGHVMKKTSRKTTTTSFTIFNNTSHSIKCQIQLLQAIITLFIVSVEGVQLENVQLGKVFTTASCRKWTLTNYLTCLPFYCLKFSQKILFDTRWMSDTFGIHNMPYYVYNILGSTLCTH